jgi:hypothetical protein
VKWRRVPSMDTHSIPAIVSEIFICTSCYTV